MKRSINAFSLLFTLFLSTYGNAQTFTAFDYYHTLLVGSTFKDTIFSSVDIRSLNTLKDPFGDVEITARNLSTTTFEITFDFSKSGFEGKKQVEINTLEIIPTISKLHRYNFTLVKSIVVANDDFVKVEQDQSIIRIDPLANDIFNDPHPKRVVVTDAKFGKAIIKNGIVEYTVPDNFVSDVITYTVENISKNQGKAAIYLYKENKVKKDQIQKIVVSEKSSYLIILPTKLNSIDAQPINGSLDKINDYAYQYTNKRLGSGSDKITFTTGNYKTTYNITLKSQDPDEGNVKDDIVYGGINQTITFNVFENDLLRGNMFNHSKELVYLGNGVFSYTPPANFIGTIKFFYDAGSRLNRETGIITIHIGNIDPQSGILYKFTVRKNGKHTFSYETPLNGYQIRIISPPKKGGASAYVQADPVSLDCGKIHGKAIVDYSPAPGYVGKDSMIVAYKMGNLPAKNYLLRYEVLSDETDCDCGTDCVWPGDVNKDGVVTPLDILGIGKNYGSLGINRSSQSDVWVGQPSKDWAKNSTTYNAKHADSNGDGLINRDDVNAVVKNLGKTSALVPSAYGTGKTFPFQLIPNQTEVDSGDLISFDIVVGNHNDPILDVYGLAFNVRINPGFLHENTIKVQIDDRSWLGHLSPLIDFHTINESGLITAAISRTHTKGISGMGTIGTVFGVVKDEVHGFFDEGADYYYQTVIPSGVVLENSLGVQMMGTTQPVRIKVNRKKTQKITLEDQVTIYPNPSSGDFYISLQGQDLINSIEIYDMSGMLVKKYDNQQSKQVDIILDGLRNGIYFAKITTGTSQVTKKISLIR